MTTFSSKSMSTTTTLAVGPAVTVAKLTRWGGVASMFAGTLTIIANLLHPPRSFATLVHDAQHTTWEVVHVLAIIAFVFSAFAVIALYAVQIEQVGVTGLIGFAAMLSGIVLMVGLLVPDSLIFPVLAHDPDTSYLLNFPGPIIGNSVFTIYMAFSGVTYCVGTVLFFGISARVAVLPRWGSLLVAIGTVPLAFGALVQPGIDYVGAVVVGVGYLFLGYALWAGEPSRETQTA